MVEEREKIWRISVVRCYYAIEPKTRRTPTPFCEIRAFIFFKKRPTQLMLNLTRERLKRQIELTEKLIDSIRRVKFEIPEETGKEIVYWTTDADDHIIEVKKKREEIKLEIDGYEVEDVDRDEILAFFKTMKKRISFNTIYRYVAFFEPDGSIGFEYDEDYLIMLEMEALKEIEE